MPQDNPAIYLQQAAQALGQAAAAYEQQGNDEVVAEVEGALDNVRDAVELLNGSTQDDLDAKHEERRRRDTAQATPRKPSIGEVIAGMPAGQRPY